LNIWIVDAATDSLLKLDQKGAILQTINGVDAGSPVFDGTNIWVPGSNTNSLKVVRASTGAVLATLTGSGLNFPIQAAFDGQRILVTNANGGGGSVSLWRADDLTPIGNFRRQRVRIAYAAMG